jgi:hypothetical protein
MTATPAPDLRMGGKAQDVQKLAEHPDYKAALTKRRGLDERFAIAVERERRARRRQSASAKAASADPAKYEEERRRHDAERANALAAGGSLVVAGAAGEELAAALEEQRLLQGLVVAANEELEEIAGRLFNELLRREGDWIRGNRRVKKDADAAGKRADEDLDRRFGEYRAAGYRFFALDALRRVMP